VAVLTQQQQVLQQFVLLLRQVRSSLSSSYLPSSRLHCRIRASLGMS
jgi:hypothetical protein